MITDINSEDRLVQKTFADYLAHTLGWESVYAWNDETFGPDGTLGRANEQHIVLVRYLRQSLQELNPQLPPKAIDEAIQAVTRTDFSRSMVQHNRDVHEYIRDGVAVTYRDDRNQLVHAKARLIDFRNPTKNHFLVVRELKIQGQRAPHYSRRADLVCFVNGLPLVFIELKAVYRNIRRGLDDNLTDYKDTIPHAFHHNAFLIVSNGDRARYGTITSKWEHFSEWKRNTENEQARLDARALLDGMLAKERILDLVENFIVFDDSRPGGTRKVAARNHQVLGVNRAVEAVLIQEKLKQQFPPDQRLRYRLARIDKPPLEGAVVLPPEPEHHEPVAERPEPPDVREQPHRSIEIPLVERAHPDLGRLGVFWHTQGSGKSYSMVFFTEKVQRVVPGNFTFVLMTDRDDLDDQLYRTFLGCSITDQRTPRASSGTALRQILKENHRYVFTLIHKFNLDVLAGEPYSKRDDIIVISDEAHRTQAGKLARNMRLALPNASFIGFTGTPLFKHDELTRRIFGSYGPRYDFRRSEQDGATVKLVYENRGEKLGITRMDLNDRIAEKIEQAGLDADQQAKLESLLGKDYEVITADDRLNKIADDFVEQCSTRWQCGKSMMVCIDKVTCGRLHDRILPRWQSRAAALRAEADSLGVQVTATDDPAERERLSELRCRLLEQAEWMETTIIEIIVSEGQNEVRDFAEWGIDIRPHRDRMKRGFDTPDGKRVDVQTAFKNPDHPFRVAIVCAMGLTGFDVECLSTLYIDKPLKAHTLMQAIARANRVYPGKAYGVIVDYNGMLSSLRKALALYAVGDEDEDAPTDQVVTPTEEMVAALLESLDAAEDHLRRFGFDVQRFHNAAGFDRIEALADAVDAVYSSDDAKHRFELLAREVFARFKALVMEPVVFQYAERHDNLEAIYKKLQERRDHSDVTALLKELHKIVNEAIRTQGAGTDHAEGLTVDLSQIDFKKLRKEFEKKVHRKRKALQDIGQLIEDKLQAMLARNPLRMDYYKRYQEIIADYNREKDRVSVEETFARLAQLAKDLDAEQRRAVEEGLSDDEMTLFQMLLRDDINKADRERVKQASRDLLASVLQLIQPLEHWTEKEQTQAEVRVFILDQLFSLLPDPPYSPDDTHAVAERIYDYVWQRAATGTLPLVAA